MKTLATLALLLLSTTALAGGYQAEIDKFFALYEKGKPVEALDTLYATNPWMSSATDAIQNVKNQLQGITKLVGNYNGKVLIDEANIKDRFAHVTYLALYDRQPVRMEFQFYRPKGSWIIYSYAFDISFDDEVETGVRKRIATGR